MPTLSALLLAVAIASAPATSLQPARFSWGLAKQLKERLHPRSTAELERAVRSGSAGQSAAAAAELCGLGNPGGRACARAEKQAGSLPSRASLL